MNQPSKKSSLSQGYLFDRKITKGLSQETQNRLLPLWTLAPLVAGYILAPGLIASVRASLLDSPKTVVDEVWQIVNNEYVDKSFNQVNWETLRQELLNKNYTDNQQAYDVIRQSLKQLGDPYTRFLTPTEFEALTNQTSGELSGIGIRLKLDEKTNQLTVVESIQNSPASKAGIKTEDIVLKINGKSTSKMTLEQASEAIRGEVGTSIKLEISRQGEKTFEISLTRAQIELPSVSYNFKQEEQMRVGYIKIDEFSSNTPEQVKQGINKLNDQKVNGFVVDLRGNPGGLLFASVDIARMLMETGTIVHTVDRRGGDKKLSADGTALTNLPLVVLVDENSASASEILAGALKDNKRATVVGTRTFGKGTVQSVHPLSDGSGLVVTISRYYPPSKININKQGIAPDVQQDLTMEEQFRLRSNPTLVGTFADPQYKKAISVLKQQKKSPALLGDRNINTKQVLPQR
jgi:carboxyl-terminal processing protease